MSSKKELKTFMDLYANKNQNTGVHSEIDNQLLSSSLNRILHADDWAGTTALYEAFTKGGEKRHILTNEPSFANMATPENLQWIDVQLRMNIEHNPNYPDTLPIADVPEAIGMMKWMEEPGFIDKLLNWIRRDNSGGGSSRNERLKKEDHYR